MLVYNKNLLFNMHGMNIKENKKTLFYKYNVVLTDKNSVIILP